jgi:hypothetical protein
MRPAQVQFNSVEFFNLIVACSAECDQVARAVITTDEARFAVVCRERLIGSTHQTVSIRRDPGKRTSQ